VNDSVGVRIDRVEAIFHRASGYGSIARADSVTMGAPTRALLGDSAPSHLAVYESESQVATVADTIVSHFRDLAVPYFERWGSIHAIDAELNAHPTRPSIHRKTAWLRCSTAIIVARLVGRADYELLAAIYTDLMTRDSGGFHLARFENLLTVLEEVATEKKPHGDANDGLNSAGKLAAY
jgi:hypothetical protein